LTRISFWQTPDGGFEGQTTSIPSNRKTQPRDGQHHRYDPLVLGKGKGHTSIEQPIPLDPKISLMSAPPLAANGQSDRQKKLMNIEHRTSNIELRMMMSLRFIDLKLNGTYSLRKPFGTERKTEELLRIEF
jgi:hypothetical protein